MLTFIRAQFNGRIEVSKTFDQGSNPCARANKSAMFGRINNYFRETRDELVNKVSWPTWEELRESTWIVLVASLLFALVIWGLDSVLGVSLTQFYKLFKQT